MFNFKFIHMKILVSVLTSIITIIIILIIILGGTHLLITNEGRIANAICVRTVDDYELPHGWEIYSNKNGDYIIKYGCRHLSRQFFEKLDLRTDNHPLKCTSEKRAKSTVKYYLDQKAFNEYSKINNCKK